MSNTTNILAALGSSRDKSVVKPVDSSKLADSTTPVDSSKCFESSIKLDALAAKTPDSAKPHPDMLSVLQRCFPDKDRDLTPQS
jgi:hypothetical protein